MKGPVIEKYTISHDEFERRREEMAVLGYIVVNDDGGVGIATPLENYETIFQEEARVKNVVGAFRTYADMIENEWKERKGGKTSATGPQVH